MLNETSDPRIPTTDATATTTDDGKARMEAAQELLGMLPTIDHLAQMTGSKRITVSIEYLRRALQGAIARNGEEEPQMHSERLMQWATLHGISGTNPYYVRHNLIRECKHNWMENMVLRLWRQSTETHLSQFDAKTVGFCALKCLVRNFDPAKHGDCFSDYAEPIVEAVIRRCLTQNRMLTPEETSPELIQSLLTEPLTEAPVESVAAAPAIMAEPAPVATPSSASRELPGEPTTPTPAAALAAVPPSAAKEGSAPPDGNGELRNSRLMQWAKLKCIGGETPYQVQGGIISTHLPWMSDLAEILLRQTRDSTLSIEDAKTAGFRTLKALAIHFDPAEHGADFRTHAEPFVTAALRHCFNVNTIDISSRATMQALRDFLAEFPQDQQPVLPREAARVTATSGNGDHHNAPVAVQFVPPPRKPAPSKQASATSPAIAAPAKPTAAVEPPPPPKPVKELSPEEEDEQKRRRRFCRWAKDYLKIEVSQDQFDEAVRQVTEKYVSFAEKFAHDRMQIPQNFRGGKTAVKKEAARALAGIVARFKPPDHEKVQSDQRSEVHIDQHIKDALELHLKEFIKDTFARQHA